MKPKNVTIGLTKLSIAVVTVSNVTVPPTPNPEATNATLSFAIKCLTFAIVLPTPPIVRRSQTMLLIAATHAWIVLLLISNHLLLAPTRRRQPITTVLPNFVLPCTQLALKLITLPRTVKKLQMKLPIAAKNVVDVHNRNQRNQRNQR